MSTTTTANSVLDPILEFTRPFQDAGVEFVEAMAKVVAPYNRALGSVIPAGVPTMAEIVDVEVAIVEKLAREEWGYVKHLLEAARPMMGHRTTPARPEARSGRVTAQAA